MNSNIETKRSEEEVVTNQMKSIGRQQNADKVFNTTDNQLLSPKIAINGMNGCKEDTDQTIDGHQSNESGTGIRLLCEAANTVEGNSSKCRPQRNGLVVANNDNNNKLLFSDKSCGQTNSSSTSHTSSATTCTTHCCRTSCSTCSATTACCGTSASTLSCDIISNMESMVKSIDKDMNCLTNLLNSDLTFNESNDKIVFVNYESERQMPDIMRLIQKDLSEPYSIYTYRYFIHNWPHLCFLAMDCMKCIGAIVCKLDLHKKMVRRGYIAMLAVDQHYRKRKIGSNLVLRAIQAMIAGDADEVVLETEVTNKPALQLYENLGFVRDKRLFRYYLNGVDALRLKLWLK